MKKYVSRAVKRSAIFVLIGAAILIAGVALIVLNVQNIELPITLISAGGAIDVISLCVFLGEKSRYLTIDTEKIILPRGAQVNGKIAFERTVVNMNDIGSLTLEFHKGDAIIALDTNFYVLCLKNGTKIRFTLFSYGKDSEAEIYEIIKSKII